MTVNNKQLIDLLTQKTGLEPVEAEQQVYQLVKYVGNQLEAEGTCTIDGLGTFGLQGGELHFEADDLLTLEINHKYAGMKPIELIGAYKDIGETPVPVTEAETPLPEPETKAEDQKEPEITEAQVEVEKEEVPAAEEQEEPEIPDEILADATPEPEELLAPEENEVEPESEAEEPVKEPVLRKEPAGKSEEPTSPATKAEDDKWKPKSKPRTMRSRKSKSSDAFGKWLVAAVIVIAVGIAGWLVYDMGLNGGAEDNGPNVTENSSADGLGAETESESSPDEDVAAADLSGGTDSGQEPAGADEESLQDSSEPNAGNSTSNIADIAEESRQSAYGLRGGATPDVKDGYTIVVHSLRDEAKVRRVNNELQQQGYRTVIFSANVMDTTFWRLGLGQFKTIEDALEAAATLPDIYKQNHFVRRIQ